MSLALHGLLGRFFFFLISFAGERRSTPVCNGGAFGARSAIRRSTARTSRRNDAASTATDDGRRFRAGDGFDRRAADGHACSAVSTVTARGHDDSVGVDASRLAYSWSSARQ